MQKFKQYWIIICLVVILIGAGFYWFQYRSYKAKKDCAWKKIHQDAKLAVPQKGTPLTQAEIIAHQKAVTECEKRFKSAIDAFSCDWGSNPIVPPLRNDYQPAQPALLETNWWVQASKTEYETCLRGKGF